MAEKKNEDGEEVVMMMTMSSPSSSSCSAYVCCDVCKRNEKSLFSSNNSGSVVINTSSNVIIDSLKTRIASHYFTECSKSTNEEFVVGGDSGFVCVKCVISGCAKVKCEYQDVILDYVAAVKALEEIDVFFTEPFSRSTGRVDLPEDEVIISNNKDEVLGVVMTNNNNDEVSSDFINKEETTTLKTQSVLCQQVTELEKEENNLLSEIRSIKYKISIEEERLKATNTTIDYIMKQIDTLNTVSVLQDTFYITQIGPFGMINGLRLGRCLPYSVPWGEINAAWGQVCLLLETIVKRCNLDLCGDYRVIPRGSFSFVLRKTDSALLELYGSDGGLVRLINGKKFDNAVAGVYVCVAEISDLLQHKKTHDNKKLKIPYKIQIKQDFNVTIEDLSVRLQFNHQESWTKALRYLLINLKSIISFVEFITS